ncbi:hypothetical protein PUN28_016070 [Cardiocondyla obscurior]|uniref:Uncharacterized protein n=1 Tax=Cardiocondyla obscurior TaxID=286306 RepID=A0AAW2EUG6_9HYME
MHHRQGSRCQYEVYNHKDKRCNGKRLFIHLVLQYITKYNCSAIFFLFFFSIKNLFLRMLGRTTALIGFVVQRRSTSVSQICVTELVKYAVRLRQQLISRDLRKTKFVRSFLPRNVFHFSLGKPVAVDKHRWTVPCRCYFHQPPPRRPARGPPRHPYSDGFFLKYDFLLIASVEHGTRESDQ